MFLSKPKSVLGVDIGAGGIKVVELHKTKNRPVLFTYGLTSGRRDVHELVKAVNQQKGGELSLKTGVVKPTASVVNQIFTPEKVTEYAAVLKAVCHNSKVTAKNAVVSLPVSAVFHAVVNLPPVKKSEFETILKAEVKKLLPRPIEEMTLDYQILPSVGEEKSQKVLINAVAREVVVFYTQIFQKAGIVLEALEPESTALERALIGRDQSVAMIVDVGAEHTNFFIIDGGMAITHNSVEIGGDRLDKMLSDALGLDLNLIGRVKQDWFERLLNYKNSISKEDFLNFLRPVVDPIVKEIEYSFELYLRQSGNLSKHPEKVVLTGGGAFFPFLADYISEQFKLKCYIGDPWGRVVYQDGLKPILHGIGPRMSVAIGLALRNMV